MIELHNFYNDGFGWICRACERELKAPDDSEKHSRLLREGEAESKTPRLSNSRSPNGLTNRARRSVAHAAESRNW